MNNKLSKGELKKELLAKKKEYEDKLEIMYKQFRGVIHEDANSEMKYTQIKVYEDFLASIKAELRSLGHKD